MRASAPPPGRVLLLLPTTTYKAQDFLTAARRQAIEVVVGSNAKQALADLAPGTTLDLDFGNPERAVARAREFAARFPIAAVIGVDEESSVLAARICRALGLVANPVEAVLAASNKLTMRRLLAAEGVPSPMFQVFSMAEDPREIARRIAYPCVVKPLVLSASRGVIRADDPDAFVEAHRRLGAILAGPDLPRREPAALESYLVESYVPGFEVALEGVFVHGRLETLAIFDKPDPLVGPFFEETIYLTPSRLGPPTQERIRSVTARAVRALGLVTGPIHAELRLPEGPGSEAGDPVVIEVAPRMIGGLCARVLRFGVGLSLEGILLQLAAGRTPASLAREEISAGVMMIPVPGRGVLAEVRGLEAARGVPGIEEVVITAHRGQELVPLPEGFRYPGFLFARGSTPAEVENALREAHSRLTFVLEDR